MNSIVDNFLNNFNYLYDTINNELSDEEKAYILMKTCTYSHVKISYDFYKSNRSSEEFINEYNTKYNIDITKICDIYKVYNKYKRNGYFDGLFDNYKISDDTLDKRLDDLNEFYELCMNSHSRLLILYTFKNKFKNLDNFDNSYKRLTKYLLKDKRLNKGYEALSNYDSIVDLVYELECDKELNKEIDYYMNNNKLYEIYPYSKKILNMYLNSNKSINEILNSVGIDKNILTYLINSTFICDIDLYKKVKNKLKEEKTNIILDNSKKIEQLQQLIINDPDMDVLEFIKLNPFKDSDNMGLYTIEYLKSNNIDNRIINEYMIRNSLTMRKGSVKVSKQEFIKKYSNILYKEDIDNVINYIEDNNLPYIIGVTDEVLKRYIHGNLIINNEHKCIII